MLRSLAQAVRAMPYSGDAAEGERLISRHLRSAVDCHRRKALWHGLAFAGGGHTGARLSGRPVRSCCMDTCAQNTLRRQLSPLHVAAGLSEGACQSCSATTDSEEAGHRHATRIGNRARQEIMHGSTSLAALHTPIPTALMEAAPACTWRVPLLERMERAESKHHLWHARILKALCAARCVDWTQDTKGTHCRDGRSAGPDASRRTCSVRTCRQPGINASMQGTEWNAKRKCSHDTLRCVQVLSP